MFLLTQFCTEERLFSLEKDMLVLIPNNYDTLVKHWIFSCQSDMQIKALTNARENICVSVYTSSIYNTHNNLCIHTYNFISL